MDSYRLVPWRARFINLVLHRASRISPKAGYWVTHKASRNLIFAAIAKIASFNQDWFGC